MSTRTRTLSTALAVTLIGGAGLGSASMATANSIPANVTTPTSLAAMVSTADVVITIDNFAYEVSGPISPGATVTVINNDGASHTVTDVNGAFDTGILAAGETGTFTAPEEAGDYEIECTLHPEMAGSVTVAAAQSAPMPENTDDANDDDAVDDEGDDAQMAPAPEDGSDTGQIAPMPEGGADTGVSQSTGNNAGVIALGGGLILMVAAGGTLVVRRSSTRQ